MAEPVASNPWGRVEPDGTVLVRTRDGERVVGSWQADDPASALTFFGRKYDELETSVTVLERRVAGGLTNPEEAERTRRKLLDAIPGAAAVGDLDSLADRLLALEAKINEAREHRAAKKAEERAAAREAKGALVAEAERLAGGADFRRTPDRFRTMLAEWKELPRLERSEDDALWHRFSNARSTYTRRRKAHFAEQAGRRAEAQTIKEGLIKEAEALAGSTDWRATSVAQRELRDRWKAAGGAPREVEEQLWQRFKAAQDAFYAARAQANAEQSASEQENLAQKLALAAQAEALLPVQDHKAAKRALRTLQDEWVAVGHVPRGQMRAVEDRLKAVEAAVAAAEDKAWQRSNPEARARAASTVSQLRSSIATLEATLSKAEADADADGVAEATAALEARRSWLAEAERVLTEFGG